MPIETKEQLEQTWIQLASIVGKPRKYKIDLQTTQEPKSSFTQTRISELVILYSPESNSYRIIPFDPSKHEANFPSISIDHAYLAIPIELSDRKVETAEHDKRTHPFLIVFNDSLTETTKRYLSLSKLNPQSLSSSVYANEIQATLEELVQELERSIAINPLEISEDGIPF